MKKQPAHECAGCFFLAQMLYCEDLILEILYLAAGR